MYSETVQQCYFTPLGAAAAALQFLLYLLQPENSFEGCKIEYRPQISVFKPPKRAVKPLTDLTLSGFSQ